MFYIMYGEDDFSLREALAEIKKRLGDEAALATSTSVFRGEGLTPDQLAAACNTIPFLAPYRLVIVEGLLGLFEQQDRTKRGPKAKTPAWGSLRDCVKRMPDTTVLVLVDGKLTKSNPLLGQVRPNAEVREFLPLRGNNLRDWMRERAQERGVSLSSGAMRRLDALVGGNLWALSSEIDKLSLYALGRTIEEEDVEAVVTAAREFTVFNLVDAILARNPTEAMKLLHRLQDEGAVPPYVLFMITRQFRLVMQAKDLVQQQRKRDEIKTILGIPKDFLLQKVLAQARARTMPELEEVYRGLLDTDISIKTGRLKGGRGDKGELALDLLITELCVEAS